MAYLVAAAAVACLWCAALVQRPLFNPDEGRYAEIPREMLASGDFLVPTLNGVAYIEKPPLQYWLTAGALRLFGLHAWSARLSTALAGLGTLLTLAYLTRGWLSTAAAIRAACIAASMSLIAVMSQLLTLDMTLTFCMTLSLCAFLRAQSVPPADAFAPRARRWMLLAWAAAACGTLVKGPVAALIPALTLTVYSLCARDASIWRRLHLIQGAALYGVLVAPWHWLAQQRLSDFFYFYFWHEHIARFATPIADRQEPWWYFLAIFVAGTFPWSISAANAVLTRLPVASATSTRGFRPELFLKCWIACILVFFSLSHSKLAPYLLPALPAAALLIASRTRFIPRFGIQPTAIASAVFGAVLLVGAAALPLLLRESVRAAYFLALRPELAMAGVLILSGGIAVLAVRVWEPTRAIAALSLTWLAALLIVMRASGALAPIYSGATLVPALRQVPASAPLYSVATYDQTLPFYLRRRVILVAYRGEMDYGLSHDASHFLGTIDEFVARWRREPQAYAIMDHDLAARLGRSLPMREIARDMHRAVVARE